MQARRERSEGGSGMYGHAGSSDQRMPAESQSRRANRDSSVKSIRPSRLYSVAPLR